jgi:RNA polymerase sigma factor (sigma-70 family)
MIERSDDLWSNMRAVAEQSIRNCAQGILTVEELIDRIMQEWQGVKKGADGHDSPSRALLARIAQRICSRELCIAWRSSQPEIRERAFENLRRYLARSLRSSRYAGTLQHHESAMEDVLHQTLLEFWQSLKRNPHAGPDDPANFLKWALTALIRHAHVYVEKMRSDPCLSLEEKVETYAEQFVDGYNRDPQNYLEDRELQQALKNAILSLRNPRYQQVLMYTFLAGVDESDVAHHLGVEVQEVYMWRYRALKALRKSPELIHLFHQWRE